MTAGVAVPGGIADVNTLSVGPAKSACSAAVATACVAGTARATGATLPSRRKYARSVIVCAGCVCVVEVAVVEDVVVVDGAAAVVVAIVETGWAVVTASRDEWPQPAPRNARPRMSGIRRTR